MVERTQRLRVRRAAVACLLISGALHGLVLLGARSVAAGGELELRVPDEVEFGLLEDDPGASGGAKPAPKPPEPPPPAPVAQRPKPAPATTDDPDAVPLKHASPTPAHRQRPQTETAAVPATTADDADPSAQGGAGDALEGVGPGSGFGTGGFGSGRGGPLGAIIALHADLERIRSTSLILEIAGAARHHPEWQHAAAGLGARCRSRLRTRVRGDAEPAARRSRGVGADPGRRAGACSSAVSGSRRSAAGPRRARAAACRLWPWHDRGPTERVAGLFGSDQIVIARPDDVGRVLSVSAALARRHARKPGMERAPAPGVAARDVRGRGGRAVGRGRARPSCASDVAYAPLGAAPLAPPPRRVPRQAARVRLLPPRRGRGGGRASAIDAAPARLAEHPRVALPRPAQRDRRGDDSSSTATRITIETS